MAQDPASFFNAIAKIAGICPHCGHVFRLSDARPYKSVRHTPTILDKIDREQYRLDRAIAQLDGLESELREKARSTGSTQAKRQLRCIDKVFSARGIDPHDVKVLCDPIDFIVFDGMSAG